VGEFYGGLVKGVAVFSFFGYQLHLVQIVSKDVIGSFDRLNKNPLTFSFLGFLLLKRAFGDLFDEQGRDHDVDATLDRLHNGQEGGVGDQDQKQSVSDEDPQHPEQKIPKSDFPVWFHIAPTQRR